MSKAGHPPGHDEALDASPAPVDHLRLRIIAAMDAYCGKEEGNLKIESNGNMETALRLLISAVLLLKRDSLTNTPSKEGGGAIVVGISLLGRTDVDFSKH